MSEGDVETECNTEKEAEGKGEAEAEAGPEGRKGEVNEEVLGPGEDGLRTTMTTGDADSAGSFSSRQLSQAPRSQSLVSRSESLSQRTRRLSHSASRRLTKTLQVLIDPSDENETAGDARK